jgi:hypothetical protein
MPDMLFPPAPSSAGAVVAIRSVTKTDTQSTAVALTWHDVTSLSITYSPTSAANKIRVRGVVIVGYDGAVNGTCIRVLRDGVPVGVPATVGNRTSCLGAAYNSDNNTTLPFTIDFIDEPASTASATWKVQYFANQGGGSSYINRSRNDTDAAYSVRTHSTFTIE